MSATAFDTGTLSWVKDEIDLALERASDALARHAAAPGETKPLAEARGYLHQACGALTIVGLAGITHFAETVETRLAALAEPAGADNVVAISAAAGAALAALRRYLDDLMSGYPDQPLRLYPAYRALVLAAGLPAPAPLALFYPDLTQRPPRREGEATPLLPPRLKALRLGFARGLAKWRSGEARGLAEMRNAIAIVEQDRTQPAERALWWVALAWFDAVMAAPDPAPDAVLLAGLDRQLEVLANGQPAADSAPGDLLAGLLYGIAVAPTGSEHLESVRAAYRLADLIPAAAGTTVETRRGACRAPLMTAMVEWERFSQGTAIALMRFHDVALLLAASARDSNDDALTRLTAAIADFAAWLRQQPERSDHTIFLEVAGALVLVEDAIEQEGARSPGDEPLFAAEVMAQLERLDALQQSGTAPARLLVHQHWRARRLISQVAREICANLDAVESVLDSFFQSPGQTAALPAAQAKLHQVVGAFYLLDESVASQVAAATESQVAACLQGDAQLADFSAIADQLATLAQFADTLSRGQPERGLLESLLGASASAIMAPVAPAAPVAPVISTPAPATIPAVSLAGADEELQAIFTEEAHEVLATLAATQPALAANPADREALTTLRRGFHTLKGSGRMVGLTALGAAAFAVEQVLNHWLDERKPVDAEGLSLIDRARLLFADWVVAIEQHASIPDASTLLGSCMALSGDTAVIVPDVEGVPACAVPPAPTLSLVKNAPAPETITIGATILSATLYHLYVEEAQGHVATLRRELAAAAGVPSRELIRAAHTLAGISAGTGFPSVQALAHALEGALVRHSLARVTPDEAGRMLLARAVGSLEGMVGAIAERRAPAAETALTDALNALQATTTPTQNSPDVSPLAERRQSRPADEVDPQLAALFIEEADEQLHQLDADLRAWRAAPVEAEIGRRMARLLHTFKGGARMCGAMGIGELAHSMETRIEQALTDGGASLAVLDGLDVSLGRANNLVDDLRQPSAVTSPPAASVAAVTPTKASAAAPTADAAPAVLLRVRADLIDHLVNEAGEMAIARSRIEGSLKGFKGALIDLTENVARLRSQLREFEIHAESRMQSQVGGSVAQGRNFDPLELDRFTRLQELTRMMAESVDDVATVQHALLRQVDVAGEAVAAQSRQNRELSHALLRARMVPFSTVVERLHRVVRQTAKELDRQANLDINGGDTPVDRNVLERMLGPLEHLLRNAVAHGIEPADRRRAAGKPELGQITLTIVSTDNDITLTLGDDGKGLDHAAIRSRAIERGLLATDANANDAELAELIFRPGFSTAATVSEIAGRGVGLDVVRNEVTQLGGRVDVGSANAAGQGTRFEIVLPLTLAMIPVMLVVAGGRSWAIPATMVEEARDLSAEEAAVLRAAGTVKRGNRNYPWHTLPGLFGETPAVQVVPETRQKCWQLLLKSGGDQIALEVEAMTQNQEVVVKPVGDQLARVPGLTGATVLPNGAVALIVNPVALALARRGVVSATSAETAVPPAPTFSAPTVMVVDDSLTVRKITGRLLERSGYRVLTAKDGIDALEQLKLEAPDVMLADIEMPRMDGFELVRALRADPRTATLPVIMITSRIAEKHRQVARELGVRHYLGKPYDEAELLALIAGCRAA
jgi:chemosensory pili system protein ChpA (sensor histidine kinase/response regulator)